MIANKGHCEVGGERWGPPVRPLTLLELFITLDVAVPRNRNLAGGEVGGRDDFAVTLQSGVGARCGDYAPRAARKRPWWIGI